MAFLPWYFDVLSPFAYLQLEWITRDWPELVLEPRPVVLGAVLAHHGQLGPAEIRGKREFTYRYVIWRAWELGIPLRFPPRHPFNPLAALRLIVAAGGGIDAVRTVFRHIWAEGKGAESLEELAPLAAELGVDDHTARIADPVVKEALRASTDAALAAGIFGVPTLLVDGQCFFGQDATPFALAVQARPQMLREGEYARAAEIPAGASRR
ncbi:MAG: 2-hydroxychromene-2-carboxylate isomerase [Xanthomonadales bacterium]|nr:2-hydroxychromene-2-carboxylate isomerase [Xanthomonadales bacterium]MCC6594337.1 2-hydroxychromene-2-carboxylate isomerase [Xanthomonadales bacterium]MCE7931384.1 2-hydroxychromene-2-carboxylate isomerase [Xanthomonadales bacterium PRO6]